MIHQFHFWVYIQKNWKQSPKRHLFAYVHSSVIHSSQKMETTQMSIDRWTDKHIHVVEYNSALKRNEILIHATTWINLEDIILSEVSQTQKDKYCVIPLIWGTWQSQIIEMESKKKKKKKKLPGEEGKGRAIVFCICSSVWDDEKVLEMYSGDGCTTLWMDRMSLYCTF